MNNKCLVDNCNNKPYSKKGYCKKHYQQIRRIGFVRRTCRDDNEFILKDNSYYEIELYDMEGNIVNKAIIDIEKYDDCRNHKWHFDDSTGYTVTQIDGKKIYLHRFIFGECKEFVDHINRNRLDCRKNNLREVNPQVSCFNQNMYSNNTSGVKGVSFYKKNGTWEAYIRLDKKIHLGKYDDFEDAIYVRLKAEKEYFGEEFAPQRHLFEQYKI